MTVLLGDPTPSRGGNQGCSAATVVSGRTHLGRYVGHRSESKNRVPSAVIERRLPGTSPTSIARRRRAFWVLTLGQRRYPRARPYPSICTPPRGASRSTGPKRGLSGKLGANELSCPRSVAVGTRTSSGHGVPLLPTSPGLSRGSRTPSRAAVQHGGLGLSGADSGLRRTAALQPQKFPINHISRRNNFPGHYADGVRFTTTGWTALLP
jgi:hypothetical protein